MLLNLIILNFKDRKLLKIILILIVILAVLFFMYAIFKTLFLKRQEKVNEKKITKEFSYVNIKTKAERINIYLSDTNENKIVYKQSRKYILNLEVENESLNITRCDKRRFYEKMFDYSVRDLTIYLSENLLNIVEVYNKRGDIKINSMPNIKDLHVNNVTGNIIINKCVNLRNIDLNSTTGNIKTEDVTSENINIKVITGNTVLVNTVLAGNLNIKGVTGDIKTEDVTCGNIGIKVTTGDAILVNTIATGNLDMNGVTGDLIFDGFDANNINAKLTTGKVKGTILSSKFFVAKSTTGKINVPETREGGECRIKLTTGNVDIKYKE